MIMIIGGAYQGKLAYAKELYPKISWADGRECTDEQAVQCEGIHHFHKWIERKMRKGEDVSHLAEMLMTQNPDVVIVTDEIGYGIVPADPFEREYREMAGRICTELAAYAKRVDRVICGIGKEIKGV